MTDRKTHDGTLLDDLPAAFADPSDDLPLPPVPANPEALDPKAYGPAVLQILERIAFADIGEYLDWSPTRGVTLKASSDLTSMQRRLVSEVTEDKDGTIKLKLCSKDQAIRLLGVAAGVLKEQHEHSGKVDIGLLDALKAIDGRTRGLPPPRKSGVGSDD